MRDKSQENVAAVVVEKSIKVLIADAENASEKNLTKANPEGPAHTVATKKDYRKRKAGQSEPPPLGRIHSNLTATEKMERKLRIVHGKSMYKKRSQMVEPVFNKKNWPQGG